MAEADPKDLQTPERGKAFGAWVKKVGIRTLKIASFIGALILMRDANDHINSLREHADLWRTTVNITELLASLSLMLSALREKNSKRS